MEVDRNLKPIAGEILTHSANRDEIYGAVSLGKDWAIEIEGLGTCQRLFS